MMGTRARKEDIRNGRNRWEWPRDGEEGLVGTEERMTTPYRYNREEV